MNWNPQWGYPPQFYGPTYPPSMPPVMSPMRPDEDMLTYIRRSKRELGELEKEFKADGDKKKSEAKPKYPTFTFAQTLALLVLMGPLVGYAYLNLLYAFVQHAQTIIK